MFTVLKLGFRDTLWLSVLVSFWLDSILDHPGRMYIKTTPTTVTTLPKINIAAQQSIMVGKAVASWNWNGISVRAIWDLCGAKIPNSSLKRKQPRASFPLKKGIDPGYIQNGEHIINIIMCSFLGYKIHGTVPMQWFTGICLLRWLEEYSPNGGLMVIFHGRK